MTALPGGNTGGAVRIGDTVGTARPWPPPWVHDDEALRQVAHWARDLHAAVATFVPPPDAVWRDGTAWRPGMIVGHNDAAPYNAAWAGGRLVGFFDWDLAAPVTPDGDLASIAFVWVPLHARHVVAAEGFTAFDARPRRLRLFLDAYGRTGDAGPFVEVVRERVAATAERLHGHRGRGTRHLPGPTPVLYRYNSRRPGRPPAGTARVA